MSTVFYGYRIAKADFWGFHARARAWYTEHHPLWGQFHPSKVAATVPIHLQQTREEATDNYIKGLTEVGDLFKKMELQVDFQLFDVGDDWVFRVVGKGYLFENHAMALFGDVLHDDVSYDNRTDRPTGIRAKEWERRRTLVDRLGEQIETRQYLLAPMVSEDDVVHGYLDFQRALGDAIRAEGLSYRVDAPEPGAR